MTHRLLSTLVVAAVATGCTFSSASACEKNKNSASAATSKNTTAAVASSKSTAAVASLDHCLMPTVATTTAGGGTSACATKMSAAECASKMAAGECSAKSSNAVMASSKGAAAEGCCMSGSSTTASAKGAKSAKTGDPDAVLVGGPGCSAHKSASGTMAHADCDNCSDLVVCEGELKSAAASMQVVPLKNGVMYVYTATGAKNVRTVQTAIARHTEKVTAVSAANGAKLCPECKSLRGAAASGKLEREVVNIEGGCLTLVTSNDPAVVNKIYTMAGLPTNTAARVKS